MQCNHPSIEDVLSPDPVVARRELNDLARHAEAAERYEDMCKFMRLLVYKIEKSNISPKTLTNDERNLLSVAYKNVIGARRSSWRTLNADEGQENSLVAEYKRQVEVELEAICREVLDVLHLILKVCDMDTEAHVFYLKMTGDYYRYLAEFKDKSAGCHEQAKSYYQQALDLARGANGGPGLPTTHPIRLGLALNFSVCYYEILGERDEACELARRAFDEAISQLDDLDETSYKDSTLIMQLLRDNLTLWTADQLNPQEL